MGRKSAGCLLLLVAAACSRKSSDLVSRSYESVATMEALVERHVGDPARAERTKVNLKELEGLIAGYYRELDDLTDEAWELIKDYDAKRADLHSMLGRVRMHRRRSSRKLIDLALRARESVTEREWTAVTGAMLTAHREG